VLSECIHTEGYLTAFAVDAASGAITQLGSPLKMTGRSTCYISFDKDARHAVITNYWDGIINVVALDERSGAPLAVVQEHQQTRRETWRQVMDREVHGEGLGGVLWVRGGQGCERRQGARASKDYGRLPAAQTSAPPSPLTPRSLPKPRPPPCAGPHVQPPGRPPRALQRVPPLLPLAVCARSGGQLHPSGGGLS
jgi:hypothetical protein